MRSLVVVRDTPMDFKSATIEDRNLDRSSSKGANTILTALRNVCRNVVVYNNTETFLDNLSKHKEDVIFPMLYGLNSSSSSKSLIPAMCEGYGIQYIGADSYAHALCNDKKLSTLYAKEFGIQSAKSVLLRFLNPREKEALCDLRLPLIVKPNFGGSSTGIAASNVTYSYSATYELAKHLYQAHNIPILVEEIVEGYEIEFIVVGNQQRILFSSEVKLLMNQKDYFTDEIWGYETKKVDDSNVDFVPSDLLPQRTKEAMIRLFQSFNKIEFMRFDGRLCNGVFHLIELSPDCYLGDDCAVAAAFFSKDHSYEDMFKIIISSSSTPDLS